MTYMPSAEATSFTANLLGRSDGEEAFGREWLNSSTVAPSSGHLRLASFTARFTQTVTQIRSRTGGVAAGATPTLCKMAVYELDSVGNGTLVAQTANDTTLWSSISGNNVRPLVSSFQKVAGRRYAAGVLTVTAAAVPQFVGHSGASQEEYSNFLPWLCGAVTGLSDVPASFTYPLTISAGRPYAAILP